MKIKIQFKNSSFTVKLSTKIITFNDLEAYIKRKFSLEDKRIKLKLNENLSILKTDKVSELIRNEDEDILIVDVLDSKKRKNKEFLDNTIRNNENITKKIKKNEKVKNLVQSDEFGENSFNEENLNQPLKEKIKKSESVKSKEEFLKKSEIEGKKQHKEKLGGKKKSNLDSSESPLFSNSSESLYSFTPYLPLIKNITYKNISKEYLSNYRNIYENVSFFNVNDHIKFMTYEPESIQSLSLPNKGIIIKIKKHGDLLKIRLKNQKTVKYHIDQLFGLKLKIKKINEDRKKKMLLVEEGIKEKFIGKQVNFYFSDKNYPKDKFIQENLQIKHKYFPTKLLLNFPKIKEITQNLDWLLKVLKDYIARKGNDCNYQFGKTTEFLRKRKH